MKLRIAVSDMVSPSFFPLIAAVELGHCSAEGIDAEIKLIFPVERACRALATGEVDYIGAAAHTPLYVFPGWRDCRLLAAISEGMSWFLVVDRRIAGQPGDFDALRGLRIGAAPGPADALRSILTSGGIDPEGDLTIGPVPTAENADTSFGVTAARALERGEINGFWANGMAAEMAIENGTGRIVVDARRHVPRGTTDSTFPTLVTTAERDQRAPDEVAGMVRAVVTAQTALRQDPSLATAAARHFPDFERGLISKLVARDTPYYNPVIRPEQFRAVNTFATKLGLLNDEPQPFDEVVSATARKEWPQEMDHPEEEADRRDACRPS